MLLTLIVLVNATEGINTAIERVIDISAKKSSSFIQIANNEAAGAVLFCAMKSIVIVGILFYQQNEQLEIGVYLMDTPRKLLLLTVSVPISLMFIFCGSTKKKKKLSGECCCVILI